MSQSKSNKCRPWRAGTRQTYANRRRRDYLTKPPTGHWIFSRISSRTRRNTIPGSVSFYGEEHGASSSSRDISSCPVSRGGINVAVPVEVPGLHVDLFRDSVSSGSRDTAMSENIVVRIVYAPKYSKVDGSNVARRELFAGPWKSTRICSLFVHSAVKWWMCEMRNWSEFDQCRFNSPEIRVVYDILYIYIYKDYKIVI